MYIRSLQAKHLKRLRDLQLNFTQPDGQPRMWTVLIGENGTGKTSVLHAIALAAAGRLRVNDLAGSVFAHLRDRRLSRAHMEIRAQFGFGEISLADKDIHPDRPKDVPANDVLTSRVHLDARETSLRAESWYGTAAEPGAPDPLDNARARETRLWFVAGYGVRRALPTSGRVPDLSRPSVDRMKPLFDADYPLTSTSFLSHFGSRQLKARQYSAILRDVIIHTGLLPSDIQHLELRGQGGVSRATDLLERDRFEQKMGGHNVRVPAVALAHGYQSTIAWVADLVGHILLEADASVRPQDYEGLVLIDEIDLYLHPSWQARLIPALRKTFPKLQFVATTHSPAVLATLAPHEVIRLQADPDTGDVRQIAPDADSGDWVAVSPEHTISTPPDPRMLSGTEVYQEFFGLDRFTLNEQGERLRKYTALAGNPYRNDYQQQELERLGRELEAVSVNNLPAPVARDVS